MSIFVDTSAFLILLDGTDAEHDLALKVWNAAVQQGQLLVTTNYVVVETIALLQRGLGMAAVRLFLDRLMPLLNLEWIGTEIHTKAITALRTANLRDLSLVDCVSFAIMHQLGITEAIAFDRHFDNQGFRCLR
jgi:predicted nucleic acid-binding protein